MNVANKNHKEFDSCHQVEEHFHIAFIAFMSSRRSRADTSNQAQVTQLRAELEALKETAQQFEAANVEVGASPDVSHMNAETASPPLEAAEATADVAGGAEKPNFRPIEFLNKGHYKALQAANAIDYSLVQRIENMRKISDSTVAAT